MSFKRQQLKTERSPSYHAAGNATAPYTETTLDFNELNRHSAHKDDLIPAPDGGCPK